MREFVGAGLLVAILCVAAHAHSGPPFPIIENWKLGGCTVSVWTNPDVGTGTFFIFVDPPSGGKVPEDVKFEIGVRPVSGRLREVRYSAKRRENHGQVEFDAAIPFDAREVWRIHVLQHDAKGGAEAAANVEVTPPGFGQWDLLWFTIPFLGVGYLWFRAATRKRGVRRVREK